MTAVSLGYMDFANQVGIWRDQKVDEADIGLDMAKSWTGRGQEWLDMVMSSRLHGQVE